MKYISGTRHAGNTRLLQIVAVPIKLGFSLRPERLRAPWEASCRILGTIGSDFPSRGCVWSAAEFHLRNPRPSTSPIKNGMQVLPTFPNYSRKFRKTGKWGRAVTPRGRGARLHRRYDVPVAWHPSILGNYSVTPAFLSTGSGDVRSGCLREQRSELRRPDTAALNLGRAVRAARTFEDAYVCPPYRKRRSVIVSLAGKRQIVQLVS